MSTEFSNAQFDAIYPPGIEKHYWTSARTRIISTVLQKNNCKGKRILEIGCGRGVVLNALRKEGFDCSGVELASPSGVSSASEYIQYGKDFLSLDDTFAASVEVILLLDVIEHIEDDAAFLKQIQSKFPNLEHILITVPARMELWSNFDVFNGHFRRYSRASLSDAVERAQCTVEYSSYLFHLLYIPIFVLVLFNTKRSTIIHPPKGYMSYIHSILSGLCVLEHAVLPRSLLGSSLIVRCSPKRV
jgi:SAM-dependent methyltransferase